MRLQDALLHGSQRVQGGDLGLGQSSDTRDIEPFVGPVAAQRAQMLATLEVPDVDSPVIAATGEPLAIGAASQRADRPRMRFAHPDTLPALYVPPAQPAVTTSTDQPGAIGTPGPRQR
jgi:hypothetical protein